jgi:Ca2+-binding EF-hand superfamily protein
LLAQLVAQLALCIKPVNELLHHKNLSCLMGSGVSRAATRWGENKRRRALLLLYQCSDHTFLDAVLQELELDAKEQLQWLEKWAELLGNSGLQLGLTEFLDGFGLDDTVWSHRIFALLDINFTGTVSFKDFLVVIHRLLMHDKHNSLEVAFRIVTRRGIAGFDPAVSCIDTIDMRAFIEDRYPRLQQAAAHKRADEILKLMDEDDSGAVQFSEFLAFADTNLVFATLSQAVLAPLRTALFGEAYWVATTRKLREKSAGSTAAAAANPYLRSMFVEPQHAPALTRQRSNVVALAAQQSSAASTASNSSAGALTTSSSVGRGGRRLKRASVAVKIALALRSDGSKPRTVQHSSTSTAAAVAVAAAPVQQRGALIRSVSSLKEEVTAATLATVAGALQATLHAAIVFKRSAARQRTATTAAASSTAGERQLTTTAPATAAGAEFSDALVPYSNASLHALARAASSRQLALVQQQQQLAQATAAAAAVEAMHIEYHARLDALCAALAPGPDGYDYSRDFPKTAKQQARAAAAVAAECARALLVHQPGLQALASGKQRGGRQARGQMSQQDKLTQGLVDAFAADYCAAVMAQQKAHNVPTRLLAVPQ